MGTGNEGLQFVSLVHRLRTRGFALGLWPVAGGRGAVRQQAPTWEWLLLADNGRSGRTWSGKARDAALGRCLLGKALPIGVASCALTAWIADATYQPGSDMKSMLTCLPMLGIYPIWLSTVIFRQA